MQKGVGPLSTIYNSVVGTVDRYVPRVPKPLQKFWFSPVGPRTVFFWAPAAKWGIIFAGFSDIFDRPPQHISLPQCAIIATSGLVWSRWSLVIIPKNYNLLAVNMFIFLTQGFLACRALNWRRNDMLHEPVFQPPLQLPIPCVDDEQ